MLPSWFVLPSGTRGLFLLLLSWLLLFLTVPLLLLLVSVLLLLLSSSSSSSSLLPFNARGRSSCSTEEDGRLGFVSW